LITKENWVISWFRPNTHRCDGSDSGNWDESHQNIWDVHKKQLNRFWDIAWYVCVL
jgi:hypothetical protein